MEKIINRKILVIGLIFLFLAASAVLNVSAYQAWSDNFDSYTNGQMLDGTPDDGGWKGWGNAPAAGAPVTTDWYRSKPNSVLIQGATDLVHEWTGYSDSGKYTFTCWQMIPGDFAGISYIIMLCAYDDAGATNVWTVQVHFDSELDLVESEFNADQAPIIYDRWVEFRAVFDFDTDWLQIYYDNVLLGEHAYTDTVQGTGGGTLNIAALDLFANGATPVYYDDISLVPGMGGYWCDAGGPYLTEFGQATQFTGTASGGVEPYTYAWTFGDSGTSTLQNPTHTYTTVGVYNVTLTVTGADAATAAAKTTATVMTNTKPAKPDTPTGTAKGDINTNYTYSTKTSDPDGNQVYYMWDWGDGTSAWLGPYNSGVAANAVHVWTVKGDYSIKVKAKDSFGAESDWSDPLPITMPYAFTPIHQFFEKLFERFPNAFPLLRQLLGF